MKKYFVLILVLCVFFCPTSCQSYMASEVEVSFDYQKQQTHGSNQYAIWVENAQNEVVKTLFVTSFTAKGRSRDGQPTPRGFVFRPACVPTWVKNSGAANMTDEALNAFTGATPAESGTQAFVWDFTDQQGQKVEAGEYRVYVEATLFDQTRVIYSGNVSSNQAGEVELTFEKFGDEKRFDAMISNVKIVVK